MNKVHLKQPAVAVQWQHTGTDVSAVVRQDTQVFRTPGSIIGQWWARMTHERAFGESPGIALVRQDNCDVLLVHPGDWLLRSEGKVRVLSDEEFKGNWVFVEDDAVELERLLVRTIDHDEPPGLGARELAKAIIKLVDGVGGKTAAVMKHALNGLMSLR